jgi:hypothetical protein
MNMNNAITKACSTLAGAVLTVKTGAEVANVVVNHMEVTATNDALKDAGHPPLSPDEIRTKMAEPSSITKTCQWAVSLYQDTNNPDAPAKIVEHPPIEAAPPIETEIQGEASLSTGIKPNI